MASSSITAGTTRTQAGATLLTDHINRVDTSTPTSGVGDGVSLPIVLAGTDERIIINNTPNNIQLYAAGTDTINGVAGATGVPVSPGVLVHAVLASPGVWLAEGGLTSTTLNGGGAGGGGGGPDNDITSIGLTSTGRTLTISNSPLTANGSINAEVANPLPAAGADGQVLTSTGGVWAPATPNVLANPMSVLDKLGSAQSTSSTTEQILHQTDVPPNTMSAHGGLLVLSRWTVTNNADTKNLHVRLGGLTGTDFMGWVPTTVNTVEVITVIQNRGVTNQQIGARLNNSFGGAASSFSTGNLDSTTDLKLVASAAVTNVADTITLESMLVLTF